MRDPSGRRNCYAFTRLVRNAAKKKETAKRNAEMLGLMVHYPDTTPQDLAAIRAKTLVIAGTKDMIRGEHTRLIAESIPGAKLVFLKGDHFIASKHPEEFNKAVLDFLRE